MAVGERRTQEKKEMRQVILNAAKNIAAADGWQNVTIRKLCDHIHYTAPVVYQYFESKERLLQALRKESVLELGATIRSISTKEKDARKQLVQFGMAVWNFSIERPSQYQVMFNLQGVVCCIEGEVNPATEIHDLYQQAIRAINRKANKSQKYLLFLLDYYTALIHGFISMNMVNKIKSGSEQSSAVFKDSLKHFVESIQNKNDI
jgi:AcrR family transcriptional regulator